MKGIRIRYGRHTLRFFYKPGHKNKPIVRRMQQTKRIYEESMLRHIAARYAHLGGTWLDVGACLGTHSTCFAKIGAEKVIAWEPQSDLADCAEMAYKDNDVQVVLKRYGLGAVSRTERNDVLKCDVELRAPSRIPGRLSLVKIDVDGTEPTEILEALETRIRHFRPVVVIETRPNDAVAFNKLFSLGYGLQWRFNASPTYIWEYVG